MRIPFQYARSQYIGAGTSATLLEDNYFGSGTKAVVTKIATYASDDAAWGDMEFSLIIDGMKDKEFGSVLDQIGSQSEPRPIPEGLIIANASIKCVAKNNSATNTYKFGVLIEGYYESNY